jgi:hypothetical protein
MQAKPAAICAPPGKPSHELERDKHLRVQAEVRLSTFRMCSRRHVSEL